MKIVQGHETEWKRGLQHCGGTFHYRHLLNGTPGTISNFQFDIGQTEGAFASPRHRHNFDQFRFQLEGTMNFAATAGWVRARSVIFPRAPLTGRRVRRGGRRRRCCSSAARAAAATCRGRRLRPVGKR